MRNNMKNTIHAKKPEDSKHVAQGFDEWYNNQPQDIKAAVDHHMAIVKTQFKNAGDITAKVILAQAYLAVQGDK